MQPVKRQPEDSTLHQPSGRSAASAAYLKLVKESLTPEKYHQFVIVMKALRAKRLDRAGAAVRIKHLFKGHPSLISGFNFFLPEGYEITDPCEKEIFEFSEALSYLNEIEISSTVQAGRKRQLEDSPLHEPSHGSKRIKLNDAMTYRKAVKDAVSPEKYYEFVKVLGDFRAKRVDRAGAKFRIKHLLKGHPSLISVFNIRRPGGYEIRDPDPSGKEVSELTKAVNSVNKSKVEDLACAGPSSGNRSGGDDDHEEDHH